MTITLDQNNISVSTTTFVGLHGSFLVSNQCDVFSGTTEINLAIPASFLKGLADCDAGRVVDMDKAMEEPPPSTD